ncbi:MAG: GNAT family N-acetyltransferase [Candidatus Brocadia sp.]|nr:GNAT family N-acetyltransferase [Candidatus Brocadia sp.]
MADTNIKARPYREGDEKSIIDLFNRVFDSSMTPEEWEWKYKKNPAITAPADWITVLEKDGRIVGHFASMPFEVKYKNKTVKSGQAIDTMLDPTEKMGIKFLYELYKYHLATNIKPLFGFGFPNERAYLIGKKFLGYQNLGEFVQLFKRLSLRSAMKRRFPNIPSFMLNIIHRLSQMFFSLLIQEDNRYQTEEIYDFDDRANALWDRIKERFGITIIRNKDYLNWRYKDKGFKIFLAKQGTEIYGYIVLRVEVRNDATVGSIIDIFSREEATNALLARALKIFIAYDVDFSLCGLVKGDVMEKDLLVAGFRRHKDIKPLQIACVLINDEIDRNYIMEASNWHLSYGEVDGIR